MTAEQRANLVKLAEFIEANHEAIDAHELLVDDRPLHFDMWMYQNSNECGTFCCLLGLGPIAGVERKETWHSYADKFVAKHENDEWAWLFAQAWKYVDNTALGGAKRIRYLLEHGCPDNSVSILTRMAPLPY